MRLHTASRLHQLIRFLEVRGRLRCQYDFWPNQSLQPTAFGGSRDDPLLSDRSWAVSSYHPDIDALVAVPTRIVIALGEESAGTFRGFTDEEKAASLASSNDAPTNEVDGS